MVVAVHQIDCVDTRSKLWLVSSCAMAPLCMSIDAVLQCTEMRLLDMSNTVVHEKQHTGSSRRLTGVL